MNWTDILKEGVDQQTMQVNPYDAELQWNLWCQVYYVRFVYMDARRATEHYIKTWFQVKDSKGYFSSRIAPVWSAYQTWYLSTAFVHLIPQMSKNRIILTSPICSTKKMP